MLDYYVMKAIFEASRSVDGKGMLLWMSNPALPSFVFQTYDYYLEQNGGYAGVKVANQPILAYLNPLNNTIELDCHDGITFETMELKTEIYDQSGKLILSESKDIYGKNGLRQSLLQLPRFEDTVLVWNTVFKDGVIISRNFDVHFGSENQMLNTKQAEIETIIKDNKLCFKNLSETPALQVSFSFYTNEDCKENIYYHSEDNFVSLKPQEEREIEFALEKNSENCYCVVEGYNISKVVYNF